MVSPTPGLVVLSIGAGGTSASCCCKARFKELSNLDAVEGWGAIVGVFWNANAMNLMIAGAV